MIFCTPVGAVYIATDRLMVSYVGHLLGSYVALALVLTVLGLAVSIR